MPARLKFFYGPMDCGKSTLALQMDHNQARQGRTGLRLTRHDRSGGATITTRVGLSTTAIEVTSDTDIRELGRDEWAAGRAVDYLIVDEAGFLEPDHVDQLADLVDDWHVDVYCFGLATDFRTLMLPGAKRLVELADELLPVHVEVLCWCGPARSAQRPSGRRSGRAGGRHRRGGRYGPGCRGRSSLPSALPHPPSSRRSGPDHSSRAAQPRPLSCMAAIPAIAGRPRRANRNTGCRSSPKLSALEPGRQHGRVDGVRQGTCSEPAGLPPRCSRPDGAQPEHDVASRGHPRQECHAFRAGAIDS